MSVEDPASQQRDVIKQISPPFLCSGTNERYMYLLGLHSDGLIDKMNQAMRARIPGLGTPSALGYIGLDRVIQQGPVETNDSFASRLTKAYDAWHYAGNRRATMQQAYIYMQQFITAQAGQIPVIVTVNSDGTNAVWDTFYSSSDINLPPSHQRVTTTNWDWDGLGRWWWAWLIFFLTNTSDLQVGRNWGDGTWGDGDGSWGLNQAPEVFSPLRSLIRLWKSQVTFYPFFILSWTPGVGGVGDLFSPNSIEGTGNPDGTWGRWSKVVDGIRVKARDETCRYIDGTGVYVGDCSEPIG